MYSVTSCSGLIQVSTAMPFFGEQPFALEILGRADAGDLGRRAIQREGHLAGEHVHLVARGQRDDDFRIGCTRSFQYRRARGVAVHGADIEAVLQIAQHLLVDVHDRDFVGFFAREVIGSGAADLAGAEHDDLHMSSRLA